MARFVKGDVVVVPFPYSDLTQSKRRPAMVITPLASDDVILCHITSQAVTDGGAVPLVSDDFSVGGLPKPSNIRANKLFTTDSNIILDKAGSLKPDKVAEGIDKIIKLVQR